MGLFTRSAKPRGIRPELPNPLPGTIFSPAQWGDVPLPYIGDGQVFGLPAFWRALNMVANGVASMSPLELWSPDGLTKLPTPSVLGRPLATMHTFDYWHSAVVTAMCRGNFVGLQADFDATGYPQQVVPIPTANVSVAYDGAGYLVYWIAGEAYSADQIVHIRAFTTPSSPWGIGVVENFRRALSQQLNQQMLVNDTYSTGSIPSGVITLTDLQEITTDQANTVQSQWEDNHGGRKRVAVLPASMTFTELSLSPEDAQFIEARQMSVSEAAFICGLSPSDLDASVGGTSITYQNIEQRQISKVTESYGPWMRRFEEAWSDLVPGGNYAKFCPENLLRTDSETRAKVHEVNIGSGVETVNEARAIEGRKPAPPKPEVTAPTPVPGTDIQETPVKVKA